MMLPTIHLNGTSRQDLVDALREAGNRLHDAQGALARTAPNGRDYYPQGVEAIAHAQAEHTLRMHKLQSVIDEILQIYAALIDSDPVGPDSPR